MLKKAILDISDFLLDRRGTNVVEWILLLAIIGGVCGAVGGIFQNRIPTAANSVGNKIDNYISNW